MLKEVVFISKKPSKEISQKDRVLQYLKNGKHPSCAPMMYKDHETGKDAIEAYYLDDGIYTWSSEIIYHFEKYNYPISKAFIEHALKGAKA